MAKVRLDFVPPGDPDIAALLIYEGVEPTGSFSQIERTTEIGTYPSYISYYTTEVAANAQNYFSIAWENVEGILGEMSAAVQGGTGTVVHEILERVKLRDPTLNETIVVQSAEYVISEVMGTSNPYDPDLEPTYRQLEAMTLLTLARSHIQLVMVTSSTSDSWVAGLVSMKSGASSSTGGSGQEAIEWMLAEAARILGVGQARVAQMATMVIAGGLSAYEIYRTDPILIAVE